MFWVEFVVLRPEIPGSADVVGKIVEINFLGGSEFASDPVPDLSVLGPGPRCTTRLACLWRRHFFQTR